MSVKEMAIAKIAKQLTAIVGEANFAIVHEGVTHGGLAVVVPKLKVKISPRKRGPKMYPLRTNGYEARVLAMQPGDVEVFDVTPALPTKRLQSMLSSLAHHKFGEDAFVTSRSADGTKIETMRVL